MLILTTIVLYGATLSKSAVLWVKVEAIWITIRVLLGCDHFLLVCALDKVRSEVLSDIVSMVIGQISIYIFFLSSSIRIFLIVRQFDHKNDVWSYLPTDEPTEGHQDPLADTERQYPSLTDRHANSKPGKTERLRCRRRVKMTECQRDGSTDRLTVLHMSGISYVGAALVCSPGITHLNGVHAMFSSV